MKIRNKLISTTQKRLVVASLSMMTSLYVFAACGNAIAVPLDPSVVNSPRITAENAIKTALDTYDTRLTQSLETHEGAIMAALAILTKQKEITADYVSMSEDKSNQVLASVIGETAKMDAIKEVIENNSARGQGHNPCQVAAEQQELAGAVQEADDSVYGAVRQEISAAPGKYEMRDKVMAQRTVIHDANYCTADQAASGMCSRAAPRAAKSLKAQTLFTPSTAGDTAHEDKVAFINNFVGFPAQPLSTSQAQTVSGTSYLSNVHRLNAIRSPAMTALKQIQMEYTAYDDQNHYASPESDVDTSQPPENGAKKDENGKVVGVDVDKIVGTNEENQALIAGTKRRDANEAAGPGSVAEETATASKAELDKDALPIIVQLEKQVARYLGNGKEYEEWNKTLIEQNDRGLLKEILQIKALKLFLQTREYEQLMSMEAMMAATVAADLRRSGLESKVDEARAVAINNTIASSIRK